MLQQVSDPLRILDVRFSSRYGFHMLGVHDHYVEESLHQVKDGLPIHPRGLEGDVRAPRALQPVNQAQ